MQLARLDHLVRSADLHRWFAWCYVDLPGHDGRCPPPVGRRATLRRVRRGPVDTTDGRRSAIMAIVRARTARNRREQLGERGSKARHEGMVRALRRGAAAGIVGLAALAAAPPHAGSARWGLAPARPTAAPASAPSCTTSRLVVWLDTRSTGVPGGSYYNLEFTNLSGHACSLEGYPGVSAVGMSGHQLGREASRNPAHVPHVVVLSSPTENATLGRSDTATVVLKITDVGVYGPSTCDDASAAGLRVFPPNQSTSTFVPYPFTACSHTAPTVLTVEAVEPGILPG